MSRPGLKLARALVLALVGAATASARADDAGKALFAPCRACHSLDTAAEPLPGPNLVGLIGRKVGGDPVFDYSPALRSAAAEGQVWTPARLDAFLADPEAAYPGLWMSMRGITDPIDRAALTRFLADPEAR